MEILLMIRHLLSFNFEIYDDKKVTANKSNSFQQTITKQRILEAGQRQRHCLTKSITNEFIKGMIYCPVNLGSPLS